MGVLTARGSLTPDIQKEIESLKQQGVEATKEAARQLTKEMMDRTPVWSGKTVRNYAWGFNGAPSGGQQDELGSGPKGPTGSLGLGDEPRRAENEAAALAEMEGVLGGVTELGTLCVDNFSDIWDLVDNGSAPTADRSRNPGGVSILAEQAVKANFGDIFK